MQVIVLTDALLHCLTPQKVYFILLYEFILTITQVCSLENTSICDLLWQNREQAAKHMFLNLAVQYCMTNICHTLCIQPDVALTIHTVIRAVHS